MNIDRLILKSIPYTFSAVDILSHLHLVLCIHYNLGLKFFWEHPIRVLSPFLAKPKIHK